jgi:hypothetical protein
MTLVKDEKHFDKFDQTFAAYFKGVENLVDWKSDIRWTGCRRRSSASCRPRKRPRSRPWAASTS